MRTASTLATLLVGLAVVFWAPAAKAHCPHGNSTTREHCGGEPPGATLGDLACIEGEFAKIVSGVWACAADLEVVVPKTVFVTSGIWRGDLKTAGMGIDGLSGADNLCQAAANRSALVPAGIYIAWLSDSATDAGDRLPENLDGYFLTNGTKVADNRDDLLDGTLDHAIDLDEYAMFLDQRFVWTGTFSDGTASATTNRCFDWESKDTNSANNGDYGRTDYDDDFWSRVHARGCENQLSLYCFQK